MMMMSPTEITTAYFRARREKQKALAVAMLADERSAEIKAIEALDEARRERQSADLAAIGKPVFKGTWPKGPTRDHVERLQRIVAKQIKEVKMPEKEAAYFRAQKQALDAIWNPPLSGPKAGEIYKCPKCSKNYRIIAERFVQNGDLYIGNSWIDRTLWTGVARSDYLPSQFVRHVDKVKIVEPVRETADRPKDPLDGKVGEIVTFGRLDYRLQRFDVPQPGDLFIQWSGDVRENWNTPTRCLPGSNFRGGCRWIVTIGPPF